jgi:hypothetical protein
MEGLETIVQQTIDTGDLVQMKTLCELLWLTLQRVAWVDGPHDPKYVALRTAWFRLDQLIVRLSYEQGVAQ